MKLARCINTVAFIVGFSTFLACGNGHPPREVDTAFNLQFPHAMNIRWEKEDSGNWEASFQMNAIEYAAIFDDSGNWVETEKHLPESEWPPIIIKKIALEFPHHKIQEFEEEKNRDGVFYEVELSNEAEEIELLYSLEGELITIEKEIENNNETEK